MGQEWLEAFFLLGYKGLYLIDFVIIMISIRPSNIFQYLKLSFLGVTWTVMQRNGGT